MAKAFLPISGLGSARGRAVTHEVPSRPCCLGPQARPLSHAGGHPTGLETALYTCHFPYTPLSPSHPAHAAAKNISHGEVKNSKAGELYF